MPNITITVSNAVASRVVAAIARRNNMPVPAQAGDQLSLVKGELFPT